MKKKVKQLKDKENKIKINITTSRKINCEKRKIKYQTKQLNYTKIK